MTYLITIFIIATFLACSQKSVNDRLKDRIAYVENPNKKDTLCISEINRAKHDIAQGKIVFTQSFGFGSKSLRYEKELRELCREKGLTFDVDLIGCVVYEGQTQGCYGDYMDKIIIEKFGIDFKKNMHRLADSLFIQNADLNNVVVSYWDCDEEPRLPSENKKTNDYLTTINVSEVDIEEDKSANGGGPFFDLGFIIEKDSTINGFYINNFVPNHEKNEKFKSELFKIAVDYLQEKYPIWVPGKINEVYVRTDNNVRLFFRKE
ncbi:hypothetical protein EYV94_25070 [Puteibacter caeruleilacunae]|nr:hypothetical protein EYV94_25070 [Puteibacter caeruleilacunae]